MDEIMLWIDGCLLVQGVVECGLVVMEYVVEGLIMLLVCLCDGDWKYIVCFVDFEMLFNFVDDLVEWVNCVIDLVVVELLECLCVMVGVCWDLQVYDVEVCESQVWCWIVYEVLCNGVYFLWDYQFLMKVFGCYMCNYMDLNIFEEFKCFLCGEQFS